MHIHLLNSIILADAIRSILEGLKPQLFLVIFFFFFSYNVLSLQFVQRLHSQHNDKTGVVATGGFNS